MSYNKANCKGNNLTIFFRSSKRTVVVSLILLFIVLAISATILGQSTPAQPTPIPATETSVSPFKVNIPDKALWRNHLYVSVEVPAGTTCKLTYIPPKGVTQEMDTTANESGMCEWRLKISEEEGKGPARLIFTINGISETHFIEIRRSF